jgi:UDP-N-acetylglucosamine pyrophosphorylase
MIDNVIILCSEITKGMKSYGPKAFVPIGVKNKAKPLIIKQIDNILHTYGENTHIYIVIGFEHEKLN